METKSGHTKHQKMETFDFVSYMCRNGIIATVKNTLEYFRTFFSRKQEFPKLYFAIPNISYFLFSFNIQLIISIYYNLNYKTLKYK